MKKNDLFHKNFKLRILHENIGIGKLSNCYGWIWLSNM